MEAVMAPNKVYGLLNKKKQSNITSFCKSSTHVTHTHTHVRTHTPYTPHWPPSLLTINLHIIMFCEFWFPWPHFSHKILTFCTAVSQSAELLKNVTSVNNKGLLSFRSHKFFRKAIVHLSLLECVEIYCVEKYCYYLPLYAETYAAIDRISFLYMVWPCRHCVNFKSRGRIKLMYRTHLMVKYICTSRKGQKG